MENNIIETQDLSSQSEVIKRKHSAKTVYDLQIYNEDTQETHVGWIRKPNLDEIGMFTSMVQNNPVKAAQILINTCWLEGDERMKTDEDLFLGVMAVLNTIIKVRVAKVTKH